MVAAEAALVPSTRLQIQETTTGALTVAVESGHRHTLVDMFIHNAAAASYVDLTIGGRAFGRIYPALGDATALSDGTATINAKGLLSLIKEMVPEWPDPYAAEDETIVLTPSSTYDRLIAHILDDVVPDAGDKTLPGGSNALVKPWITFITNGTALAATGTADLDTPRNQTGYPDIKDNKDIPPRSVYTIHAIGFWATKTGTSLPEYLHIYDEQTHLYDDSKTGICVNLDDGNHLKLSVDTARIWRPEIPHVFMPGHTPRFQFDGTHDTTNDLDPDDNGLILIGVREGPGAG